VGEKNTSVEFKVELLLLEKHPLFSLYDDKSEHGCYKVGRILVAELIAIKGLPSELQRMNWNEKLREYDDVAEIDSLIVSDGHVLIIQADELMIEAHGQSVTLILD
jgi:hypothetical protein